MAVACTGAAAACSAGTACTASGLVHRVSTCKLQSHEQQHLQALNAVGPLPVARMQWNMRQANCAQWLLCAFASCSGMYGGSSYGSGMYGSSYGGGGGMMGGGYGGGYGMGGSMFGGGGGPMAPYGQQGTCWRLQKASTALRLSAVAMHNRKGRIVGCGRVGMRLSRRHQVGEVGGKVVLPCGRPHASARPRCVSDPTILPPTTGGPEGPPRPPGAWESVLRGLHGVMGVFGRITMLVDENTYAVNFFIQALLQLLDRSAAMPCFQDELHASAASSVAPRTAPSCGTL